MREEEETHHIPVKYPDEAGGPVVTTTMKAIVFLISYTSALIFVVSFVFRAMVASQVQELRFAISTDYAKKSEIIGLALYHAEKAANEARLTRLEIQSETTRQLLEHYAQQVMINTERLNKLEKK